MSSGTQIITPVTIVTGFLGAGKTTLLNHVLRASHGRRIGVLINEFGEIGIDADLIVRTGGPVVELANGCICCATQGDLHGAIERLLSSDSPLDALVLETSGLADPGPIENSMETERFSRDLRLDGVITLIDAENFDDNLDRAEAAFYQITRADLLLINKTDLVPATSIFAIENALRRLNPRAGGIPCEMGNLPIELLLGARLDDRGDHAADLTHRHTPYDSAVLTAARPLDAERFDAWLESLSASVYRAKGFVRISTFDRPLLVQLVGGRRTVSVWAPTVDVAGAKLVVIGRKLDVGKLSVDLQSCVVNGTETSDAYAG